MALVRLPDRRVSVEILPATGPGVLVNTAPGGSQFRVTAKVDKALGGSPGQVRVEILNLDDQARTSAAALVRRSSALDPLAASPPGVLVLSSGLDGALAAGAGQEAATLAVGGGVLRVSAGYDLVTAPIFVGSAVVAPSVRRFPNWVTTITGTDGGLGLDLGLASSAFPAGTPFATVIDYCRKILGLGAGTLLPAQAPVAVAQTTLSAALPIMGQARQILASSLELLEVDWWIDDGDLYLVDRGLALPRPPHRVVALDTGEPGTHLLLADPQPLGDGQIALRVRLAPTIKLCEPVVVVSSVHPGTYRVVAVSHRVDNRGGPFETSLVVEPIG